MLEATYYSAPIPRNYAALTFLGLVLDRIHLPGVYLPTGGYSEREMDREIGRLRELEHQTDDVQNLAYMLEFAKHAGTLSGLLVLEEKSGSTFGADQGVTLEAAEELYQAIHGPSPTGWRPWLMQGHHKQIPHSEEFIGYPSDYYYQVGAGIYASRQGLPLINDLEGLPFVGHSSEVPKHDATSLSTILALKSLSITCPEIPLLSPENLMEFRSENEQSLSAFRRSMLRFSAELNEKIDACDYTEFEKQSEFFVRTEIVPSFEEITNVLNKKSKSWLGRSYSGIRLLPRLAAGAFTMEPTALIAKFFADFADGLIQDVGSERGSKEALKRTGLYYLAQIGAISRE